MTATQPSHGRILRPTAKVLPEHARGHNRSLVLQTLYRQGPQSRADVSRETGLTRVTISDLVAGLMQDGFVIELGQREAARPGKPATMIDIDRAAFQIIGVDLSDQHLRAALLDLDGTVLDRENADRAGRTGDDALAAVVGLIEGLMLRATAPLLGIGVGSPGIVDADGTVLTAPNLAWTRLPLQAMLRERFDIPVLVANDADVAVLAEHSFGRASGDVMLVKVGAGVGAGLILGGRPFYGSHSAAGEIGHVVIGTDGGPACACGKIGCLEAWLSVPRLTEQLAATTGTEAEQAAARELILREAGRRLGIILAPVVGALNLSEIVLSGPTELLDGPLATATIETLRKRTMAEFTGDLALRMTSLAQDDIVLRGAAVMVLSGQLGVS
ncbi:ROK family transcriptional regulator [Microterricola viridarii]|uniref:Sugar kinase of the NBD/HSP70 family, may contain an N-terminal HTH domain n=1 Tax=Microterricola viridarii TaxID=412690 RepID=A0A1H1QHQ4_9MICO|nr:ROK family transcriptional regulator [Microterricola viridarii]SDS22965.1 Sugar kinase of the NBD/HSP70 family, may contain an N-terminal HTH domain [Microterricola viridarii]